MSGVTATHNGNRHTAEDMHNTVNGAVVSNSSRDIYDVALIDSGVSSLLKTVNNML